MRRASGTALILVLVLLTALLLLGLPFLASQRISMAGTQSFASARLAAAGRLNAANAAIAVAAIAQAPSLTAQPPGAGTRAWSNMPASFAALPASARLASGAGVAPLPGAPEAGAGSVSLTDRLFAQLHLRGAQAAAGTSPGGALLSATISDEAGKLDPNTLSAPAWQRLLIALRIPDWNDQQVYAHPGPPPPGGYPSGTYVPSADNLGQLAKALAGIARWLPQGRIADIDQLLLANPQQPGGPGSPCYDRLRWPLTRAELERLRPHLTLWDAPPGRCGLIDLGTVVRVDPGTVWLDSMPDPLMPILGVGTRIRLQSSAVASARVAVIAQPLPGLQLGDGAILGYPCAEVVPPASGPWAAAGSAVAMETSAPLNVHQLDPIVRLALGDGVHGVLLPSDGATLQVVPTEAGLWSVSGRTGTAGPPATASLAAWINPVSSGIELPPLGIASAGFMSVDAAASVLDMLGHPRATDAARLWVQAVPQELLLERRWLTQGDWQAVVGARWASRMDSQPRGCERVSDLPPDDHDLGAGATLADIPAETGVGPRPLPCESAAFTIAAIPSALRATLMPGMQWPLEAHPLDWRVGYGCAWPVPGAIAAAPESFLNGAVWRGQEPASLPPPAACMRADGFYHAPATVLTYSLASNLTAQAASSALLLPRDASLEMGCRHVGLWVRPEADWGSGRHPLLSVRMPAEDAGVRLDGSAGNPACENLLSLCVDADHGLLVLALAPPSVESLGDAGPGIDAWSPSDPQLDHQTLGDAPVGPLAPAPYADGNDPGLSSSLASFSSEFARNRILHCYAVPPRDGRPYFRAGQWYRIDVAIASDRPDGVALLVDGHAGRDAARIPGGPVLSQPGDHMTLPGLVLETALPGGPIASADQLSIARIAVAVPAPLTVRSVLPSGGVVRIDDEYIAYGSIAPDGSALLDCWRGRRQATVAGSAQAAQAFPTIQAHPIGTLVAPGGYRLDLRDTAPPGARLYRGGCTLAQPLTLGDPRAPMGAGACWVAAGAGGAQLLASGTGSLAVDPASGDFSDFPPHGIVVVANTALWYGAKGAASLDQLAPIANGPQPWQVSPPSALGAGGIPPGGVPIAPRAPIVLVSLQLQGADPIQDGRYAQNPVAAAVGGGRLLSLQDHASGSIEWITYDGIASAGPGLGFLISRTGFADATRHRCRTQAAPHAAGTLAIPVQTELARVGHWMMTGDAITLVPRAGGPGSPTNGPAVQLLVRYGATDGWSETPGQPSVDVPNDAVAFAGPIPDAAVDAKASAGGGVGLPCADVDIVCGDGWSGADLSPETDVPGGWMGSAQPRGMLPRLDLWSHQRGAAGIDAQISIASDDHASPSAVGSDCTVDDLVAGGLTASGGGADGHDGGSPVPDSVAPGVARFWRGGDALGALGAPDSVAGLIAEATTPIFAGGGGNSGGLGIGLVLIDGEVFAYGPITAADAQLLGTGLAALGMAPQAPIQGSGRFARLLGRGLLSDAGAGCAHVIGCGDPSQEPLLPDGMRHGPTLGAIRLPLGPVRLLDGAITDPWWGLLASDDPGGGPSTWLPMNAPMALICAPDGSRRELLQPLGPRNAQQIGIPASPGRGNAMTTAAWLRGLYNTPGPDRGMPDWQGGPGAPRPVVIGWWPRYPSAMSDRETPEQLRSRTFPWIGCPVAVAGGFFDSGLRTRLSGAQAALPMVSIAVDPDPLFAVEARAGGAADGWHGALPILDWSSQQPVELPVVGADPTDASALFTPACDGGRTFSDGAHIAPCDGMEVRIGWRYAAAASSRFEDIADAGGRAPRIRSVRIRYLAPARILAQEAR